MANNSVNRSVNIFIETGDAQKSLDKLIAKEKDLKQQLAAATDPAQIKKLQAEIDKLQEPITRAGKKLSGELSPSIKETANSIAKLTNELKNMSKEDPGFAQKVLQLKSATLEYNKQKESIGNLKQEHESLFTRIAEGIGIYKALDFAIEQGVEFLKGIVDETLEAEEANSKLKNILDNLGRLDVFESLQKEAEKLQETFHAVKGEEIINSFSQLATYGKLSENQIKAVEPVIIDFARKSGISIQDSTSTIIKALEGNGKALKEYGINVKDGQSVTERFSIIMDQLKTRVDGAEESFEKTKRGGWAVFKESIANIQEGLGNLIGRLFESKKSADELFDEAKVKADNYEKTLHPLLERYDELKSKANLNKNEHQELKGIIQKIAEILPESVTEFNKYGEALDINRGKLEDFSKIQNQFLDEKQAKAVKQLTDDALTNVQQISNATRDLNNGGFLDIDKSIVKFAEGDRNKLLDVLKENQRLLLKNADELINKYGQKLPDSIRKAVDSIKTQFDAINKVKTPGEDTPLNPNADDPNKKVKKGPENQFADDLQKLSEQASKISALNKSEFEKKLEEAQRQYDAFQALFDKQLQKQELSQKQHDELLKQAAENFAEETHQIRIAEINRALAEQEKAEKELNEKRQRAALQEIDRLAQSLAKLADQQLGQISAEKELAVLKATGKKKLEAQKAQLDQEEVVALSATDAVGKKRELIEEQYRQKRLKLEKDYYLNLVQTIGEFINTALQAFQSFSNAQTERENSEVANNQKATDKKKQALEQQLNSGIITRKEYDRQVAKLDSDEQANEKKVALAQFKRNKAISLVTAGVNVAEGITKTLATYPYPLNVIFAALTAAAGYFQIREITKQQPPTFARGGFTPDGPSHSQGGIKLIDGRTGRLRGEIEGGEPILSRATYRNNRSLVDALLNTSMHHGGATLQPVWRNAPVSYMNFSRMQQSFSRPFYGAVGGITPGSSDAAGQAEQSNQLLLQLATSLNRFNSNIEAGIQAHVDLNNLNDQQKRLDSIINDARGK